MTTYEKPTPIITLEQKAFWEYAKKHELRMQKCSVCGFIRYPASIICPNCHTTAEPEWVKLSGKGKVYSFVIFRHVYAKVFSGEIPYAVGSIELEEGPRIMGRITGIPVEDIKVDMPVSVFFEDITEEFALPQFKAAA